MFLRVRDLVNEIKLNGLTHDHDTAGANYTYTVFFKFNSVKAIGPEGEDWEVGINYHPAQKKLGSMYLMGSGITGADVPESEFGANVPPKECPVLMCPVLHTHRCPEH